MGRPGGPGPLDPIFDVPFTTGLFAFNNTPGVTPLAVTINKAAGQDDPTNATPILFTVVFSEPVTSFVDADVTLTGTAGATTAVVSGTGPTYTVTVSGMTTSGGVTANILAGVTTAVSTGQPNSHSTSTDNTVAFQAPPPLALTVVGTPLTSSLGVPFYGDYISSLSRLAFMDAGVSKMFLVDVSTNNPSHIGNAAIAGSGTDAIYADTVNGDWVWGMVVGGGTVVCSINCTNPAAPFRDTDSAVLGTNAGRFLQHGGLLFCSRIGAISIFSAADETDPGAVLGTWAGTAAGMCGHPNNDDVILVASGGTVKAIDASTPSIPVTISSVSVTDSVDIIAIDNIAYYVGNQTFGTIDITSPSGITLLDEHGGGGNLIAGKGICVEPNGLYAYACGDGSDAVLAFDCSDPTDIQLLVTLIDGTNLNNAYDLHIDGDRLFVTCQRPSVQVVAITR